MVTLYVAVLYSKHRDFTVRTVLSSPSVIIITKKMIAKKVEPIMFAMASGYVMKSKLGPGKHKEIRVSV